MSSAEAGAATALLAADACYFPICWQVWCVVVDTCAVLPGARHLLVVLPSTWLSRQSGSSTNHSKMACTCKQFCRRPQ